MNCAKRLYEDPEQTIPSGIAFPVTVVMELYFDDENIMDLVEGSFVDQLKNTDLYDLIKARNRLADGYPECVVRTRQIKVPKDILKECAEMLEMDIPEDVKFHDVEVKL